MRYVILTVILVLAASTRTNAQKIYELPGVTVSDGRKVDTVFGTWKFSVADYEFYEDKLILLAFGKSMRQSQVVLTDARQKILSSFRIPDESKELYKDYQGHINIICTDHIYRIKIKNDQIGLASLPVEDYRKFIMPCLDSIQNNIYFSNYDRDYPEFSYYAYNTSDSSLGNLRTIADREALKGYNMEYYFLKPKERVQAWKFAAEYGVDKHRVAAAMSGLTSSMHYTPLYAPLFVLNDTVFVFDHYSDAIFSYDRKGALLDSVHIAYHHPKNWREWKHKLIVDELSNEVYALYQKGGYYYLKNIDIHTGKIKSSFKLFFQYTDKLKVRNGYVYYVYSPFESLQEFFVYRESIR